MRRSKIDKAAIKKQFPNAWNYKGWYYTKKEKYCVIFARTKTYYIVSIGDKVFPEEFSTEGECKSFIDRTRDKFNKEFKAADNERMRQIKEANRKATYAGRLGQRALDKALIAQDNEFGLLGSMIVQDVRGMADIAIENVKSDFQNEIDGSTN